MNFSRRVYCCRRNRLVDDLTMDNIVDELTVDELTVDELTLDELTWYRKKMLQIFTQRTDLKYSEMTGIE